MISRLWSDNEQYLPGLDWVLWAYPEKMGGVKGWVGGLKCRVHAGYQRLGTLFLAKGK